jgi:hypothetical protein
MDAAGQHKTFIEWYHWYTFGTTNISGHPVAASDSRIAGHRLTWKLT